MSGVIELRGLRVMGTHGVLGEEQERPQPFEIDLDVEVDISRAAARDDLHETLDYAAVAAAVERVVATERVRLLETLAERIAEVVLSDSRVQVVSVAVRKLRPPVAVHLATAGVRIRRARSA